MTIQTERRQELLSMVVSLDDSSNCSELDTTVSTSEPSSGHSSDSEHEGKAMTSGTGSSGVPIPLGFRKVQHERSDSYQIRSRLLNKLGIEKMRTSHQPAPRTEVSRIVQLGEEDAFNIPLKADHGLPDRRLQSSDSLSTLATSPGVHNAVMTKLPKKPSNNGSRSTVTFDAAVKVHPIPARSDYSQRMRNVLWVSNIEIQQNAARNSLEFAAEQWDVNKVVEDQDMVVYAGERVHPIHFIPQCNLQEHFSTLFDNRLGGGADSSTA